MKKRNLLLLSVVFGLLILPIVFAAENTILNATGNDTSNVNFALSTTQVTTNPEIDANITYCTTVNITGEAMINLTAFLFYLPDNSTTSVLTDFVLRNASNSATAQDNATAFVAGNYNYVSFVDVGAVLNGTANGTTFNITYMLDEPIDQVKLSASRSGRVWTETWNITSSATNLTIENASLIVTPTYWYTRIGNPTSIQFNSTAKSYSANLTAIKVYTDLNISSGAGNLLEYGSGWSTLSIAYNGPTIDTSSGKSSSAVALISRLPAEILAWVTPKGIFFILGGLVLIGGGITLVVILVKKK